MRVLFFTAKKKKFKNELYYFNICLFCYRQSITIVHEVVFPWKQIPQGIYPVHTSSQIRQHHRILENTAAILPMPKTSVLLFIFKTVNKIIYSNSKCIHAICTCIYYMHNSRHQTLVYTQLWQETQFIFKIVY